METEGMSDGAIIAAGIGAAATIIVGLLTLGAAYFASKRDRRRELYGHAIEAVVKWREQVYRVRRRDKGQEREVINRLHDLQDALSYYEAWIGSESRYMKRSFDKLVSSVNSPFPAGVTTTERRPTKGCDAAV